MAGSSVYIGIDPGASGGLAALSGSGPDHSSMPDTERDIFAWLEERQSSDTVAVIEKVYGFIGTNASRQSNIAAAHTMFRFGQSYGFLRGCLVGIGIPFEEVTPQTWQKGLDIPSRKKTESKTAWKNRLKQFAQQLFPTEKITLATSDALLIAEFCRRKHEGLLT